MKYTPNFEDLYQNLNVNYLVNNVLYLFYVEIIS